MITNESEIYKYKKELTLTKELVEELKREKRILEDQLHQYR